VKTQVEFNPGRVTAWRQIGYDKHQLTKEQFRDNTVDAAEIGAAESGTALYSIQVNRNGVGPLGVVRVRFRVPSTGDYVEEQWELDYTPVDQPLESAPPAMRLAVVATGFAEWLTANPYAGNVTLPDLERFLAGVPENFVNDERPRELRRMIGLARTIAGE
jgi:Ca-activated chloride channel family protein